MGQGAIESGDTFHVAHIPEILVDGMDCLIDQHTAAFRVPPTSPGIHQVIIRRSPPFNHAVAQNHATQFPRVDRGAQALGGRPEAPLEDYPKSDPGPTCRLNHYICGSKVDGDWLLAHHMDPGLGRGDHTWSVIWVRRAHERRLKTGRAHHLSHTSIGV